MKRKVEFRLVKKSCSYFILTLIMLAMVGCSRNQPEDVAKRYWDSILNNDLDTLHEVAAKNTIPGSIAVGQPDEGSEVSLADTSVDGDRAEVDTMVKWIQGDQQAIVQLQTVLIKEEDAWKVDIRQTRRSLYTGLLESAFSGLGESIQESAEALQAMGADIADEINREILKAGKELQKQAEQASKEFDKALEEWEGELNQ